MIWSWPSHLVAGVVEKTYRFGVPTMERTGDYVLISLPGTSQFGQEGRPSLPFQPVILALPPGESADSIIIEYLDPEELQGSWKIQPARAYRLLSENSPPRYLVDEETYQSDRSYPGNLAYEVRTEFMNGYSMALSAFTPVSYIPKDQKVTIFRTVRVVVFCSRSAEAFTALKNLRNTSGHFLRASSLVHNTEQLVSYSTDANPPRIGDYLYLVITGESFAQNLDTLVRFYERRGIPARCYTLGYIDTAVAGADQQTRIREFIHEEYLQHGVEYVLLAGDVQIIPYRGFYCHVVSGPGYTDSNIPADLYYSALDGTWNDDNDNLWGEPDEDDLLPEVAVGRLTFSDAAELSNMLNKVFSYQQDPVIEDLDRPLLAGEWLYGPPKETWGSDYMRLLIGHQTYNGYVTDGIPALHDIDSLYDEYGTWSKQRLIDSINAGRSYIHHVGHANTTYTMKLYNSDITNANFYAANGVLHNYPVVYTHGCICGDYSASDCIGEKMIGISNFASAFVGNSRYGWFVEGTADGPSQHLHREFIDALYSDSLYRIGMAHMVSKAETAPFVDLPGEYEPGAHRWCFYDCNVLGDPAMALWTEAPHSVTATVPPLIQSGSPVITVTFSFNGLPQKGIHCGLFQSDTLLGFGQSDGNGDCSFQLSGTAEIGEALLVYSGMNVLPDTMTVGVADHWLGTSSDWNDPLNWSSGQVPDSGTRIIIPALSSGGHYPIMENGSTIHCRDLLIQPGASVSLGKNDHLIIHGN